MTPRTTAKFRKVFTSLSSQVQRQARRAYRRFQENPRHPSLHYKRVHPTQPIHSVRISKDYRAVGVLAGDEMLWFWIGSHAHYDQLLSQWQRK